MRTFNVRVTIAAESILCRQAQIEGFYDEYMTVKSNKVLKSSHRLFNLMPYLDEDGVLKVYGRSNIFMKCTIIIIR